MRIGSIRQNDFQKKNNKKMGHFMKGHTPVLHFLISVVCYWEIFVEAVVGGVTGRVVNDSGVPAEEKYIIVRVSLVDQKTFISQG